MIIACLLYNLGHLIGLNKNLPKIDEKSDRTLNSEFVCSDFIVNKLCLSSRIAKLIQGPKGLNQNDPDI